MRRENYPGWGWLVAHASCADEVLGPSATHDRIVALAESLLELGYKIRIDVGVKSVRAIVTGEHIRSDGRYKTLEGFLSLEEARVAKMREEKVDA